MKTFETIFFSRPVGLLLFGANVYLATIGNVFSWFAVGVLFIALSQ